MPVSMPDPEDEEFPRLTRRTEEAHGPWWRPRSKWGRIFLGVGALTGIVILFTVGYIFKTYLERDARFRIAAGSNIQATGLTQVTRTDILPVFGEDIGRNIFFVPLNQRRKQLEKIPWVQSATVMRLLPDQLRISVVERTPVAFVRHGQQIGLVDANGVLLSMSAASMSKHHYSFPVVTGIDPGDPLTSRKARMSVYGRLVGDLDSTGQRLSEQISEIDLTDPEDARVMMPEPGADILAHFGDDQFLARYQRYKTHIAEWRQQYPKLASVDLRYEQQVVLEMAGAGGTRTTTDDGKAVAGQESGQQSGRESNDGGLAKPPAGVKADPAPKAPAHKPAAKPKAGTKKRARTAPKRTPSIPENRQVATLQHQSVPAGEAGEQRP